MENIRYKEIDYFKECCIYIQNKYAPNSTIGGIRSQIDKSVKFNKPYKNLTFINIIYFEMLFLVNIFVCQKGDKIYTGYPKSRCNL